MSNLDWRSSRRLGAKVRLSNLDVTTTSARTIREEHIQALVEKFQSESCIRFNPDNYIKVLVDDDFPYSLSNDVSTSDQVLDLPDDSKITILQGKHRVLAAEIFLCHLDKWWIADFYTESGYF